MDVEGSIQGAFGSPHPPSPEVVGVHVEDDVDLIVMGTHGRTGLAHMMIGSVAEKVVRRAPCPVLTVKHPEHEFIVA